MDVFLAILYSVLVLSFLVIIHEFGHFFAAKLVKIKTLEFGLGYPPLAKKLFRWLDTDFTLNWIPFGGFVRMQGEDEQATTTQNGDFSAASIPARMLVIVAGVCANYIFGIIAFAILYMIVGIPTAVDDARIAYVFPDSPAAQVKLPVDWKITEVITQAESVTVSTTKQAITELQQHKGKSVSVVMTGPCTPTCADATQTIEDIYIRTDAETPDGEGAMGIMFKEFELQFYPWWQMIAKSLVQGTTTALQLTVAIYDALGMLITELFTQGTVPKDVSGPVGIVDQAVELDLFDEGALAILDFAGMLSINLAIMNLLPFLPLDGGKGVMVLLELLFPKDKVFAIEQKLSQVGYIFFLALIVLITFKDVIGLGS